METGYAKLTVCFEAPFWICLYERYGGGTYSCCKLTFGAEPGDQEVYAFLLENWRRLDFSPPIAAEAPPERKVNPKRAHRQARKEVHPAGLGTKAQQALALQREEGKARRTRQSRAEREAEQDRRYALRQKKQREKHRGH